ncbi:hypothetical protein RJ640_025250 [Escallonia rubra]|uniref:Uncharacterized protein n=1 Tax=Escallonia rubra TaxID=112253 RepID=A0AA88RKQ0_9ASTE|nr:hypothetical protein RJ640_025250 [Escallonia rubra]
MGASQSCSLCPDDSNKEVRVMKEDGESIRLKGGTRVRDILDAYPYHKVIRCCSDRTVLAESFQLSCNWLYFLLPEGLAVNDETYRSLIRCAMSKDLIVSRATNKGSDGGQALCDDLSSDDDDDCGYKKPPWKPTLQSIREVNSAPMHADA